MVKFFKENLAMIWKVVLTQIAMMVFGLIVVLATRMINPVLYHIAGGLSILLYLFVLYSHFIEKGNEDKIKIDGGRMARKNFYGLFVYLCAQSLNIILSLVTFITYFFTSSEVSTGMNEVYAAFKIITHYYNGAYLSVTSLLPDFPLIYLLLIIPGALVCFLSYFGGIRGIKHFMPESKKVSRERTR
ncbi:MAG: hypothetical protein IJW19_02945 [Clostridia bacterium]|nr:hypothetical protein [Clostridia bacterium]